MSVSDFFKNRKIVVATKHNKETIIRSLFGEFFGVEFIVPENFDTDAFGTFTRDKKRVGDQLEAARKKALAAMQITGLDAVIASEGSFDAHPSIPFVTSNLELVLFVDIKNNVEVRGHSRTFKTNMAHRYVRTLSEAVSFAESVGFPEHGVIIRERKDSETMFKEVTTWEVFKQTCKNLLYTTKGGIIFLETDMRAHRNPTRMKNIELALKDLIKNIESTCPECGMIGFVPVKTTGCLHCESCGRETDVPAKSLFECQKCKYEEERRITEQSFINPGECSYCNP